MEQHRTLQVGIIGCGYQGGRLASAIKLTDSLSVTACMDINQEAAVKLTAAAGNATVFPTVEDLLERTDVDVVMVATPHHVLAEISIKAIQAGKHVLAEKPIGVNESEAILVQQALERQKVCYTAGYSFRDLAAWRKVKELLNTGAVGEILSIAGIFGTGPLDDDWISLPESGGGPLLYVGSHLIDQVLWYLQDTPVEVFSNVRYRPDTKADETSAFQIRFRNGTTVQLLSIQAAPGMKYQLDIYGRAGRINLRPCGFLDYEITIVSSALEDYHQPTILHPEIELDPRDYMHLQQLNDFVQAIQLETEPPVTITDARQVLKVIDAVFESNRTGKPVNV